MSTAPQTQQFTYFKDLPSALEKLNDLKSQITAKKPAIFLDYDGTLTPIVENPQKAFLSQDTREVIAELSRHCLVAVISGRDRKDVEKMVDLDLIYAGSHGYDIAGPNGMSMQNEGGVKCLPSLEEAHQQLTEELKGVEGTKVERKKYAIAVHYRHVEENQRDKVLDLCDQIIEQYPDLKKGPGKMIMELKPDMDWHKGKALLWLLESLDLDHDECLPIYIGDDMTDEDAFESLNSKGVGILVGDHTKPTFASYTLNSCSEVKTLLESFLDILK